MIYSKSGVIAYVRFTRATNLSADDKGDQLYTLACLVKVYLQYAAGDLLHFIYRDRYVVKFWGRVGCTFFKFCLYGKTGLVFKLETIIINHHLEFSGTRVKYLDHEKRHTNMISGLIAYPQKPLIIAHSGVYRGTRCLKVVLSLLQLAYFVYVRRESPGEVMHTCSLV